MEMSLNKGSKALLAGSSAFVCAALATAVFRRTKTCSLIGKVVVITGGSRGLGLALAHEFGKCGARLVLAARDAEELQRGKDMLLNRGANVRQADILLVPCDLTHPLQPEALIREATNHSAK